jgi:hypothetical protein
MLATEFTSLNPELPQELTAPRGILEIALSRNAL